MVINYLDVNISEGEGQLPVWFLYGFGPGLYTRAYTESNKNLGDKTEGIFHGINKGQYFTVLTSQ